MKYIILLSIILLILIAKVINTYTRKKDIEHFRFRGKKKLLNKLRKKQGNQTNRFIKEVKDKMKTLDKIIMENRKSSNKNNTRLRNIENHLMKQNKSDVEDRINKLEDELYE